LFASFFFLASTTTKIYLIFRHIQEVLNNSLDREAREFPPIEDLVGCSPYDEEFPENLSFVSEEPVLDYPSGSELIVEPLKAPATKELSAQKYIDQVMMNSGLLKPEQEHLFQTFMSMEDGK
jgi:biotin synthase-related radical SAM superfamily protein